MINMVLHMIFLTLHRLFIVSILTEEEQIHAVVKIQSQLQAVVVVVLLLPSMVREVEVVLYLSLTSPVLKIGPRRKMRH
jgi:hypothetical protein